jgi:hypothetical protein
VKTSPPITNTSPPIITNTKHDITNNKYDIDQTSLVRPSTYKRQSSIIKEAIGDVQSNQVEMTPKVDIAVSSSKNNGVEQKPTKANVLETKSTKSNVVEQKPTKTNVVEQKPIKNNVVLEAKSTKTNTTRAHSPPPPKPQMVRKLDDEPVYARKLSTDSSNSSEENVVRPSQLFGVRRQSQTIKVIVFILAILFIL